MTPTETVPETPSNATLQTGTLMVSTSRQTHCMAIIAVLDRADNGGNGSADNLLATAMSSEPLGSIIMDGLLAQCPVPNGDQQAGLALPEHWRSVCPDVRAGIIRYQDALRVPSQWTKGDSVCDWLMIANARFAIRLQADWLWGILNGIDADVVSVNAESSLSAFSETVRLTSCGQVGGFHRLYHDAAQLAPISRDWPHCTFIRTGVLEAVMTDGELPLRFADLLSRFSDKSARLAGLRVAGSVEDLHSRTGLFSFVSRTVDSMSDHPFSPSRANAQSACASDKNRIAPDTRFFGSTVLGRNVQIESNVIIVGPTVIGDNATIRQGAIVKSSVIGPGVSVGAGRFVRNQLLLDAHAHNRDDKGPDAADMSSYGCGSIDSTRHNPDHQSFRTWPRLSYATVFKRIADVIAAVMVLSLFVPIFPFIVLAIKLACPGPIFFKHKRQGLHGREFFCLKFRTMIVGADKIQDRLRRINQVDGPQFKMDDDPRVNAVGRFFRDTCLDEIPQFINVLLGQMSVVGPRPSPQAENSLCPPWRDARLSVRPGITGLWQTCRTRREGQDFQEWIHFDTKYVKELSLGLDIRICRRTAVAMLRDFAEQF